MMIFNSHKDIAPLTLYGAMQQVCLSFDFLIFGLCHHGKKKP